MKLIKLSHERCSDFAATTYVFAPDEWDEDKIQDEITLAQEEYLRVLKVLNQDDPRPYPYVYNFTYFLKDCPDDMTIGEYRAEMERQNLANEEWEQKRSKRNHSFDSFLSQRGFIPLWDNDEITELDVYWGHNHGLGIQYGVDKTDTFPSPAKLLGKQEYSDFDFG